MATSFSHQRDGSQTNSNTIPSSGSVYVPPHLNSNYQSNYNRNGSSAESRYSKDQLLDLFRAQEKNASSNANLDDLYVEGWNPASANGGSSGGWGKRDDHKDGGPEICWDHEGSVHPIGLIEMSEEEREVLSHCIATLVKKESLTRGPGFLYFCQFPTETSNTER